MRIDKGCVHFQNKCIEVEGIITLSYLEIGKPEPVCYRIEFWTDKQYAALFNKLKRASKKLTIFSSPRVYSMTRVHTVTTAWSNNRVWVAGNGTYYDENGVDRLIRLAKHEN